ncbi:class III poly(R)-hydroxyalkanoic acid synthase subunit PhaC [Bacillus sp. EAC]|uniref:class III poly(R)-hydroxyalkanoic acid synthase subunit PhaC n=1 Tax=Bacillus sp. EAC TaxID=1978338 RepID=UPI000B431BF1|nr:class III poly(R)-hydroxyalkanoic acid synthase subunit PhaC [Bacillus sp. EAC]
MISSKSLDSTSEVLPQGLKESYKRLKRTADILIKEGEPLVGQTPKEVIWTKNKSKLYRYIPTAKKLKKTPILLVYALINKPYILDLTKGNSFVEYLVGEGFDVYLLDWGTFGYEDRHLKFDDIVHDYIAKAVNRVLRFSGSSELSILGYCMGGTLTSIYAALHKDAPIKNLIFLTSPFDFSDTGLYGAFLNEKYFALDKAVDTLGNIPPEMIDFGNKMLKPITNFVGPYVTLLDRSDNTKFIKSWQLMQKWVADGIPFPGEAYRQWIRDFYQQNKLIKGELEIRGRKVDLSTIKANVLNISATKDHIAMPCQVEALNEHISSEDKQYVSIPSGHVSVMFGPASLNITYPTIGKWLKERS